MGDIYCYSYVEDAPSAAVVTRTVAERNATKSDKLIIMDGFPALTHGWGDLKKKCPSFLNMAKAGIHTIAITDLDTGPCAGALIREWFGIAEEDAIALPTEVVFRVAVREVESWILADREVWADYIGISETNFSAAPDTLADPKQHLLNVVRKKGRRKRHREMLPRGTANIGPGYNDVLCAFVEDHWSSNRASARSPSLKKAIDALNRV